MKVLKQNYENPKLIITILLPGMLMCQKIKFSVLTGPGNQLDCIQ